MSIVEKIKDLCDYNGTTISKLETTLGFSNGSLTKNNPNAMRSDRVQEIANYFDVTPTYLLTDMVYCVCPVCGTAYRPTDDKEQESHKIMHKNYLNLREKAKYLLNPTQAATKRSVAQNYLKNGNLPDEGKVFHYETLIQCDYAEEAYFHNFNFETNYNAFIRQSIRVKKYFDLLSQSSINLLAAKYDVDLSEDSTPLINLFQQDKVFMQYMTDLWDLPEALRYDVYKAIRHAKRDYADKEYFTNPYAGFNNPCNDYDYSNEKCKNCNRKGEHQ